jgi:hypothetical protein
VWAGFGGWPACWWELREEEARKKEKKREKPKKSDRWTFNGIVPNMLFYGFGLGTLFCASNFPTRKHEFGELNSVFSVRVFMGSFRDALNLASKLG